MNGFQRSNHLLLGFSIAYAAMNPKVWRRLLMRIFSIAYAAMNHRLEGLPAVTDFSIAYAAMNPTLCAFSAPCWLLNRLRGDERCCPACR